MKSPSMTQYSTSGRRLLGRGPPVPPEPVGLLPERALCPPVPPRTRALLAAVIVHLTTVSGPPCQAIKSQIILLIALYSFKYPSLLQLPYNSPTPTEFSRSTLIEIYAPNVRLWTVAKYHLALLKTSGFMSEKSIREKILILVLLMFPSSMLPFRISVKYSRICSNNPRTGIPKSW